MLIRSIILVLTFAITSSLFSQNSDTIYFNTENPLLGISDTVTPPKIYSDWGEFQYHSQDHYSYIGFYRNGYNELAPIKHGQYYQTKEIEHTLNTDTILFGQYSFGFKTGSWKEINPIYNEYSIQEYEDDKKNGAYKLFHEDKLLKKGKYINDKLSGEWLHYSLDSTIVWKKEYYNKYGELDSILTLNDQGSFCPIKKIYYSDDGKKIIKYVALENEYELNQFPQDRESRYKNLSNNINLVFPKNDGEFMNGSIYSTNGEFALMYNPTNGTNSYLLNLEKYKIIKAFNTKPLPINLLEENYNYWALSLSNSGRYFSILSYGDDYYDEDQLISLQIYDLKKEYFVDSAVFRNDRTFNYTSPSSQLVFNSNDSTVLINLNNKLVNYNFKNKEIEYEVSFETEKKTFLNNIYGFSNDLIFCEFESKIIELFDTKSRELKPLLLLDNEYIKYCSNSHLLSKQTELTKGNTYVPNSNYFIYNLSTKSKVKLQLSKKILKAGDFSIEDFIVDEDMNVAYLFINFYQKKNNNNQLGNLLILDLKSGKILEEKLFVPISNNSISMATLTKKNDLFFLGPYEFDNPSVEWDNTGENYWSAYSAKDKTISYPFRENATSIIENTPYLKGSVYVIKANSKNFTDFIHLNLATLGNEKVRTFSVDLFNKDQETERNNYFDSIILYEDTLSSAFIDLIGNSTSYDVSHFFTENLSNKGERHYAWIDFELIYLLENKILINKKKSLNHYNLDKKIEEQEVIIYASEGGGCLFYTTDNHYYTTLSNPDLLHFEKDLDIYKFEQFDLKYNRPDIILDRLGYADQSLIDAYYAAYQKRLKKMGFTEDMLKDDFHLPEIKIENFEEMPSINDNGSIQLDLKLEDSKYKLDRINVWVNDVAIYGVNGISLRDKNVQNYSTNLSVDLAKGNNKVQISVLNQVGAESYKETFELECTAGKKQADLYLITIGESKFEQADFNLNYAAKDAEDISKLFANSKAYSSVFSKTLTNEQVTKENILALKSFLEKADINDEVMIFIAGHGVLDANLDYFFATYDMDFQNPAEKGLAYEDLESLLDGIKPLKKTLMIDACHSGEIDKDEVELAEAEINEGDNIQFRVVGNTATPKLGTQNTSELTKSLFTDLRKGTGATVISSAGGMEFAMEGDDWSNGLFTYCFIKGIKTKAADYDKNGEIWLSEIKRYVSEQVTELSNGKQQPTSRIENQVIDFRVW